MNKDLELLKQMGERIRIVRNSMKMNKEELAKELGITGQFLGVIESGRSTMSYDKLRKLCQISGYSSDYILFGKNYSLLGETKELLKDYKQEEIEEACEIIKKIVEMLKDKSDEQIKKINDKIC